MTEIPEATFSALNRQTRVDYEFLADDARSIIARDIETIADTIESDVADWTLLEQTRP